MVVVGPQVPVGVERYDCRAMPEPHLYDLHAGPARDQRGSVRVPQSVRVNVQLSDVGYVAQPVHGSLCQGSGSPSRDYRRAVCLRRYEGFVHVRACR